MIELVQDLCERLEGMGLCQQDHKTGADFYNGKKPLIRIADEDDSLWITVNDADNQPTAEGAVQKTLRDHGLCPSQVYFDELENGAVIYNINQRW